LEQKKKLIFTNAGILFFGKNPQQFIPESYITVVKYASLDRFSIQDKQDIQGNLIEQIEQAMQFILRHIAIEADFSFSKSSLARRENVYEYPLVALREALVNAVAHRDYFYDGSHIYIHIYPTHIDFESPGGLYQGLTLKDLGKRSVRRNRLIADLLHHAHYIEKVGSGFDRMKQALNQNSNPPMGVEAANFFDLRFYKRLTNANLKNLSQRQIILYRLFEERETLSKKEISLALKISSDTAIRELNQLLQLGLIKKKGEGKATRYSKV
jgi:ATP-dependent DNA helicase RecG